MNIAFISRFLLPLTLCCYAGLLQAVEKKLFKELFSDIDTEKKQVWSWQGQMETRTQYLIDNSDYLSRRQRFWNQLKYLGDELQVLAAFRVDYDHDINQHHQHNSKPQAKLEVLEMYFNWDVSENLTYIMGKKRVTWGVADGKNTMDLINPIDGRDPIASGRSGNRLASHLISMNYRVGDNELEWIVLPKAEVNREAEYGNLWQVSNLQTFFSQQNQGVNVIVSGDQPDGAETGLRFTYYGSGLDINLMYFNGYNDIALYQNLSSTHLQKKYERYQAYSVQMAKSLSNSTIRAELTFKNNLPITTELGLTRVDFWQGVIGWDYQWRDHVYINLQTYFDSEAKLQSSEIGNLPAMLPAKKNGVTFAIDSAFFDEQIHAGLRGIKDFRVKEHALQTYVSWQPGDHWQLSMGRYWFNGDVATFGGEYHRNEYAYIEFNLFL